jgi:hypothetical protein
MKIAVFGDSFAADADWDFNRYPGWVERLRRLEPTWQVDNYARSGSSFWYSWSLWRRHHANYDRSVVFVTHWDRQTFSTGDPKPRDYCHVPNINQLEHNLRSPTVRPYQRALQALYDYWLLVNQEQQRQEQHTLMLEDIARTDTQLIPCFYQGSLCDSPNQTRLYDISLIDQHYYHPESRDYVPEPWGKPDQQEFYSLYQCIRTNHINEPNSDLMASSMRTWALSGHLDWDTQPWCADTTRSIDYYFKRI